MKITQKSCEDLSWFYPWIYIIFVLKFQQNAYKCEKGIQTQKDLPMQGKKFKTNFKASFLIVSK